MIQEPSEWLSFSGMVALKVRTDGSEGVKIITAAKSSMDVKVTKEFQFSVSSVTADKGKIEIDGECFLYDRATPTYTLIIGGSEASTTVEDKKFRATVDQLDEKAEVKVKFKGYLAMPTGIWINGEQIEYVAGKGRCLTVCRKRQC